MKMYDQKKTSIYVILFLIPFITSCAGASGALYTAMTDKYSTKVSDVKRSGDAQKIDNYENYVDNNGELISYEDNLVSLRFPKNSNLYYIAIDISNNSKNTIYIDWDDVEFIDADGEINDILKDGVKSNRKTEGDWSNGTTAIEPGESEVHAFIPFPMYRTTPDNYGAEFAFTCKGKIYDFEVTTIDYIQGGFNKPDKCSVINSANLTVLQFANYTEPKGKNFSVILPIESGENTAKYNLEFFVDRTVK